MEKHADKALVDSLLQGDEQAFTRFFDDYFPRLFQFACTRLQNDASLAEEAAQAALVKAMQKLATYRGEAALFTWLCTFCRHEISAIIKKEQKLGAVHKLFADDENATAALDSMGSLIAEDPFLAFEQHQLQSLVHNAKIHIPALYSDILEWKYVYGYSIKEIAEKIQRSPKATESLLTRARIAFREAFSIIANAGSKQYSSSGGEPHD